MKLVYLTAQKYPSKKTEPFFWKSMATGFQKVLGNDFTFVVRNTQPDVLLSLHSISIHGPASLVALSYFLHLPRIIRTYGWGSRDTIFFGQDPYLLAALLFWKNFFSYKVCSDWHQLFGDWRDAYIARRSDVLVATSERLKNLLIERVGASPQKTTVAYGGVDLEPYERAHTQSRSALRKKLSLPEDAILVGYAGGIRSVGGEKGLGTMVRALPFLPAEYRVVLIGARGPELEPYRMLAGELGVLDRCVFMPWLQYVEYAESQVAMDMLVIPYPDEPHYRDFGFPMKVWEYMAAGRPIIYSDLPIIGEALKGRAATFTPGDERSLAEVILGLRQDWDGTERVAKENRNHARAFTWEARAARIVDRVRGLH